MLQIPVSFLVGLGLDYGQSRYQNLNHGGLHKVMLNVHLTSSTFLFTVTNDVDIHSRYSAISHLTRWRAR